MSNRHIKLATAYGNITMFVYGTAIIMFGTLLPEIIRDFSLNLSQGGLIATMQGFGGLAVILAGSVFADRMSKPVLILLSFTLYGFALLTIGFSERYISLILLYFLAGFCLRILDTMLNAFIGDIHSKNRGYHMNMLHLFFGVGAFVGPIGARLLLQASNSWRNTYLVVGVACLLVNCLGLWMLLPARKREVSSQKTKQGAAKSDRIRYLKPGMLFLGTALLLYSAHQSGISAWIPHFMTERIGTGKTFASAMLSLYWIGIITSRLIASRISKTMSPQILVAIGGLIGGGLLTVSLFLSHRYLFAAVLFVTGALTGASIPLAMVVTHSWFPTNTGSMTLYLSLFMLGGRLVSPWLMGVVADSSNLQVAMLIPAVALALCGGFALLSRKR